MKVHGFFFALPLSVLAVVAGCKSSSSSSSSTSSSGSSGPPPVSVGEGGVDPVTGVVRYLAMGDSLTEGVGTPDPATGAFPARLADRWRQRGCKVELKNVGVAGYTAQNIIDDQLPAIAEVKPTFITLQDGANDIANNVSLDTYRANIKKILDTAKQSGARIVVLPQNEWYRSPEGQNYGPGLAEKRAAFDTALIEETNARGLEFVDLRSLFKQQADAKMWVDDGLHPTPEAYDAWAAELARVIPSPCGK